MTVALPTPATTHLANIPSPDRGVWFLGPVPIRAYALCIIVGIVIAIFWAERRWTARGGRKGAVTDIAVFAVPFGLVGGRIYHVLTDYWRYFGADSPNPWWGIFQIWQGGLGIWGAVALGAVGAWIGCRRRGVPLPAFADAVAPGLVVAQAIGRLGNYFNQELYGGPTELPWGLEIYRREPDPVTGVAVSDVPVEVVHPTFLYELLWNLLVALLVVWADRKFRMGHGRVFALYVAGYTVGRFWIEMMRTDPASTPFDLGIRINVYVSALVFLCAVAYLLLVPRGREEPHLLLGKPMPGDPDYGTDGSAASEGEAGERESGRGSVAEQRFRAERAREEESPESSEHGTTGGTDRSE